MNSVWRSMVMIIATFSIGTSCTSSKGPTPESPASTASGSGPVLVLQDSIPFSEDAEIRESVRTDCNLPEKLSKFIKEYASDYSSQIVNDSAKAPKSAQILNVEIFSVMGGGGGAWSGGKSVSIKGTLQQNGKTVGSFKARRFSGGGMFGGYKGTCSIMGRCVKTLGRDVAEWLRHPTQNAILGDM